MIVDWKTENGNDSKIDQEPVLFVDADTQVTIDMDFKLAEGQEAEAGA